MKRAIGRIAMAYLLGLAPFLFGAQPEAQPIRVGLFPLEPLNFQDVNGEPRGFNVDLLREIEKSHRGKWHFEFVPTTWAEGLEELNGGTIDLMMNVHRTPQRARTMDYNQSAVLEVWGQVFVPQSSPIGQLSDLRHCRIGVMALDNNGKNFLDLAQRFSLPVEVVEYETHAKVFEAVAAGKVAAGVAPQHYGIGSAHKYGLMGSPVQFSPAPVYFAVQKGRHPELLAAIDRSLADWKMDKDSFYYDRLDYWLNRHYLERYRQPLWVWALLAGLAAVVLLATGMIRVLRFQIRLATAELAHNEAMLLRAQEIAHVGSWEFDIAKKRLEWSDETYRIFGVDREHFHPSYEAFLEMVHPEDRAGLDVAYAASVREGHDEYASEHRIIRKDTGEVRHLFEKCVHERDAAGTITRSFGMVHDITERKLAELALKRQNEELYRFNRVATGRELRMIHLKEEVNALCRLRGEPERYPLEFKKQLTQRSG